MKKVLNTLLFAFLIFFVSCNKDELVTDSASAPVIIIDNDEGVFEIKKGRELIISPDYRYIENAVFSWTLNGKYISSAPEFIYTFTEEGIYYVQLRIDNNYGYAEEEFRVDVKELTPPVITYNIPTQGLKVMKNTDFIIEPDFMYDDLEGFNVVWKRNGNIVSNGKTYTFNESEIGIYNINIEASNVDGKTNYDLEINVVNDMPYVATFPVPCYCSQSTDRYTYVNRSVYLRPHIEYFDNPVYKWFVNGKEVVGMTERTYPFTPSSSGEYIVTLKVFEGTEEKVSTDVRVICVDETEDAKLRPQSDASSMLWNKVYDFTPAPGQFVNETNVNTGYTGKEQTMEQAIEYATSRLKEKRYVSLGTFGGYIVVGFDHSVVNNGGSNYDFAIQGNAFSSSNEPGIVWVMQDINGNGLPDDEWYELKGSETGLPYTVQDYEVTYFRPAPNAKETRWTDSFGNSGKMDHNIYHTQPYYYPNWIQQNSYTLCGTCLRSRNVQSGGYWSNDSYDWGYVDNAGNDCLSGDGLTGSGQRNGFKISNAIYPDGKPVNLKYIDFIKVQVGVLAVSGALGEISTEVYSFEDL